MEKYKVKIEFHKDSALDNEMQVITPIFLFGDIKVEEDERQMIFDFIMGMEQHLRTAYPKSGEIIVKVLMK